MGNNTLKQPSLNKKTLALLISSALAPVTMPVIAAESGSMALEEIIVTASLREENVQNESRSIAVLTETTLEREGIFDAQDIQNLVPGLTINKNSQNLQVSIRGVGDRTINNATDPAVSFNIDGVYFPRSHQITGLFYDLERVEVLKGPQGTLYGRNATAGAINMSSIKPKFENSGFIEAEAGDYNLLRLTGAANFEVNDKLAVRIAGQSVERDGFLTDGYNDEDNESLRLGVLYEPSESTSLLISGTYTHLGGKGQGAVVAERFSSTPSPFTNPSNPWAGPNDTATLARIAESNPGVEVWPDTIGFQDIDVYSLMATLEHTMDWATLTVIPSYITDDSEVLGWGSMIVSTNNIAESEQFAFETRLSSPDDSSVKWVVGGYWSEENITERNQSSIPFGDLIPGDGGVAEGFVLINETPARDTESYALFGEANIPLTDRLHLITGLRYTEEEKQRTGFSYNYGFPFGPPVSKPSGGFESVYDYPIVGIDLPNASTPGAKDVSGSRTDDATNYRLGLEYDIAESAMLYGVIATGFKAGGFFDSLPGQNSYEAEELTSYTLGLKSRFMDDRIQLNVEAFYWDYKDKQETFLGTVPGFGNVLQTRNAGEVTLQGLDFSIIGRLTENSVLSFDVEYVDSVYDEYAYITPAGPSPLVPFGNCIVTVLANTDEQTDCSGNPLVRAPELSGRLAYTLSLPVNDAGELVFNVAMTFASDYFFANDFSPLEHHPSYETYDSYLSWEPDSNKWSATLWVKNITDENVYHGGLQSNTLPDAAVGQIGSPRTYGARVKYRF